MIKIGIKEKVKLQSEIRLFNLNERSFMQESRIGSLQGKVKLSVCLLQAANSRCGDFNQLPPPTF